jgi:hypothetical protein
MASNDACPTALKSWCEEVSMLDMHGQLFRGSGFYSMLATWLMQLSLMTNRLFPDAPCTFPVKMNNRCFLVS